MSNDRLSLRDGLDEYLVSLHVEKGLSSNTISAYTRDLVEYLNFLGDKEPDDALVASYISHLRDRGLANSTVSRKVASLRGFHRFLVAEEHRHVDPTAMVAPPKRRDSVPKALNIDETFALIEAPDIAMPVGRRDRAILETLYGTGCRVSELVGIDLGNVDLEDRTVRVTGKGNKQRIVPVGGEAVRAVQAWLPDRLELVSRQQVGDPLFVSLRGRRLSRQAVFDTVKKHAEMAGLDASRVSPHVLRHSAATHMVEAGADLRTVQEILGHATITTTQVYTRVSPAHVMEIYVEAHPRSR